MTSATQREIVRQYLRKVRGSRGLGRAAEGWAGQQGWGRGSLAQLHAADKVLVQPHVACPVVACART